MLIINYLIKLQINKFHILIKQFKNMQNTRSISWRTIGHEHPYSSQISRSLRCHFACETAIQLKNMTQLCLNTELNYLVHYYNFFYLFNELSLLKIKHSSAKEVYTWKINKRNFFIIKIKYLRHPLIQDGPFNSKYMHSSFITRTTKIVRISTEVYAKTKMIY